MDSTGADALNADEAVAEAIHYVAGQSPVAAQVVFENPSYPEWLAIWERVTKNGLLKAGEFRWGTGTLADAEPAQ